MPVTSRHACFSLLSALTDSAFCAVDRLFMLEDAIGYVAADELIEVTPGQIRLRKRVLEGGARRSALRKGVGA